MSSLSDALKKKLVKFNADQKSKGFTDKDDFFDPKDAFDRETFKKRFGPGSEERKRKAAEKARANPVRRRGFSN